MIKRLFLAVALAGGLSGCASLGLGSSSTDPMDAARRQVDFAAVTITDTARGAKVARDAGLIKPGSQVDADIAMSLQAAAAAIDNANAQLHANNPAGVDFYASAVAAALAQVALDIARAKQTAAPAS